MKVLLVLLVFSAQTGDPIGSQTLGSYESPEECVAAIDPIAHSGFDGKASLPTCVVLDAPVIRINKPQGDGATTIR